MPIAELSERTNPYQRLIGETHYVCQEPEFDQEKKAWTWKEIPGEILKLHIYLAAPSYNDDQLNVSKTSLIIIISLDRLISQVSVKVS